MTRHDAGTVHPGALRGLALALVAASALAGCAGSRSHAGSHAVDAAQTAASDGTTASPLPADPSPPSSAAAWPVAEGPRAVPSRVPSAGPTAHRPSATVADPVVPPAPVAVSVHTTPGLADGATALPAGATANDHCRSASLRLDPVDLEGSPGGTYANFRLVNLTRTTCAVEGYVGAQLLDDAGRAMATSVRHEAGPDVWIRIASGGAAQFHLRFPNPMSGDTPCNPPNAARVHVTLPSIAGSWTAATPDGGIQACNGAVSTAPVGST